MKLTTKQVADKLGISTHTVREWAKQGKFKAIVVGNGMKKIHRLYDSKSVNEFAKSSKVPPVKKSPTSPINIISRLDSRLDKIEKDVKKLLEIWS